MEVRSCPPIVLRWTLRSSNTRCGAASAEGAGSVMTVDRQLVLVPFDARLLQQISQATGGKYFEITQGDELRKVYKQLGRSIGWERRRTEVTSMLAGGAGLFMLTGALLSLIWFRRIP